MTTSSYRSHDKTPVAPPSRRWRHGRDARATEPLRCTLNDIVLPHVGREDLAGRMAEFYAAVDEAVIAHGPVCRNRGDCCKFDQFGHKLYVTAVELAYFVRGNQSQWHKPNDNHVCPFQIEGRCTAREYRPLGCRIFFCDPDARDWQGPDYEHRLSEIRRIGSEFGIAYRYVEWLSALEAVSPDILRKNRVDSTGIDATHRDMID